jgi:hypothetical protein
LSLHFFFGTLRDRDVLEVVLGRSLDDLEHEPATLPGHRLARVIEESYPALVEDPVGSVEGELVRGLGERDIARIGWFEGEEYETRRVEVVVRAGGAREWAIIQTPTEALEVAAGDWNYAAWQRDEKGELLTLARGHMALLGKVGIDEAIERWDERREALERTRREG